MDWGAFWAGVINVVKTIRLDEWGPWGALAVGIFILVWKALDAWGKRGRKRDE